MDVIMLVSLYPVLFIIYYMILDELKPKKNIILGVTLSYDARHNEELKKSCNQCKKELGISTLILFPIPLIALLFDLSSVKFMIYMTWMVFAMLIPYIVYGRYHLKIKRLKQKYGWKSEYVLEEGITVDMKVAAMTFPKLNYLWFLPSVILAVIPLLSILFQLDQRDDGIALLILYGTNLVMTLSFAIMHRVIYHQRAEIVDSNSNLTSALTRVRRYHWSKCMMIASFLTGLFSISVFLLEKYPMGLLINTMVYTVALCYFLIRVEFVVRNIQQKLTEESGQNYYLDEDEYWILGMFYYNIHDKHMMVNSRVGMGTTLNMAKFWAKVIMGLSGLCIFALPFLGIYMLKEELTPITVEIVADELVVNHVNEVLRLELDKIRSVSLLEQLPSSRKIIGSNFEHMWKGEFSIGDMGKYEIYLNPKEGPFLVIETGDENYMVGSNTNETEQLYHDILIMISEKN